MRENSQDETSRFFLDLLKPYGHPGARLLDVGAGTGDFSRLAKSYFTVQAVEPSPYLAQRIRDDVGCPVFEGAFEAYEPPPDAQPDVVVCMDIIEDAADSVQLLQRAHALLRPGGVLFICTVDSRPSCSK